MSRYDWSWNRSYDRGFRPRPMRGYGSDFGDRGGSGWWRWAGNPAGAWPAPSRGGWGRPRYERFGGYDRYDRGFAPRGGSWGRARGYDRPMFRDPFVPEPLYHQSEHDEPVRSPADPWSTQHQGFELSDEEIRSAVRQNLFNDNWIDAERIQVEVAEQVVTLTGEVDDYLEARYAWDDAWEAVGVRGVINQLTVRNEPAPQSETRAPAKQARKK
jgi:BON domain